MFLILKVSVNEWIKNLLLQSALSHECYNITTVVQLYQEHEYRYDDVMFNAECVGEEEDERRILMAAG